MSIEAMKQALEALNYLQGLVDTERGPNAAAALRQAIEQAEKQEPVAWRYRLVSPFVGKDGTYRVSDGWTLIHKPEQRDAHSAICGMEAEPLYTTPQPQQEPVAWQDTRKTWVDVPLKNVLEEKDT
jgi:hypothetical protein